MGITALTVSDWEYVSATNGKPRFIYNIASASKRYTIFQAQGKWTSAGLFSGADISDDAGPAVYGIDSRGAVQTSTSNVTADVYYNIENPQASYGVDERFDCMAIINHNFNDGFFSSLDFETSSTDGAYQTVRTYTLAGGVNNRIWIPRWDRDNVTRAFNDPAFIAFYTTNARYFRIKLTHNTGTAAPAFGEIIFGRSVWLKGFPTLGWDDKWEESAINPFEAKSGDVFNYVNYSGRKLRTFNYKTADEEEIAGLDALWKQTGYGSNSFLFETPTTWTDDSIKTSFL